jgi:putative ABC transport system permease protein
MIKSFLTITIRNFLKNSVFSLINITGLALGISCFTIILLFVEYELSYDTFHRDPENVYRIVKNFVNNDGARIPDATTPPALTTALRHERPEVEHATRFFPNWDRKNLLAYGDKRFYEMNLLRIDSNFFRVFDFEFIKGSKEKPFHGIHSILLTETTARKYFGDENPIGKIIRMNINNGTDYQVTGILKDAPANSHFTFDVLIPFESGRNADLDWGWYSFYTYVRLRPGADPKLFETNVRQLFAKHQPSSLNEFYIQPLTDIHLRSSLKWELSANGDITYIHILLIIAVFVIVVASINYINLSTAQAAKRAKEVGVRKVTGAFRHSLIRQFLFESVIMVVISSGLSVIITSLILPAGKSVLGSDLSAFVIQSQWVRTILPLTILLIGILAGVYPALYLSSFQPLKVLRGNYFSSAPGIHLRQALVVFQFIISTVLITGFLIINEQLDYIRNKKLGFDQENIVMLPNIRGGVGRSTSSPESMAEDMKKINSVNRVARADGIFGFKNATNGVADKIRHNHITLNFIRADYDFIPTLNIQLDDGRNFSPEFPSDSGAIIINEKAAAQLGLNPPIIGQSLAWDDDESGTTHDLTIVGVVKDFHFTSFHEEIKPFGFILEVNNGSTFFLKIHPENTSATLKEIEKVWTKHQPDTPFDYSFQDEYMAKLHKSEARFQSLFSSFTLLAIVIACLGLFGLVAALAESKTKEIGIRKVLGSTVSGIITLLSKEFARLVLIALIVSTPLAYVAAAFWLRGFAYRIEIGWTVFAIAGIVTFVIAFATVCLQSAKAALVNPVNSLRNE